MPSTPLFAVMRATWTMSTRSPSALSLMHRPKQKITACPSVRTDKSTGEYQ